MKNSIQASGLQRKVRIGKKLQGENQHTKNKAAWSFIWLLIGWISLSSCRIDPVQTAVEDYGSAFQGDRAYQDVNNQVEIGPRIPGTTAHQEFRRYTVEQLEAAGWDVEEQVHQKQGILIHNLIASRSPDPDYILLGAHYDTRILADQDPDPELRDQPVPGANDGASGVAVLLELARTLPDDMPVEVRLVFFDAEDNGGIGSYDWIMGSEAFVDQTEKLPQAAVIVDMIGDADLQIYREKTSTEFLVDQIWDTAHYLGYSDYFLEDEKYAILDDHTPFLEQDIPAVDLIDFDYPYWHTTADTVDKVSAESLEIVGKTLTAWLLSDPLLEPPEN